MIVEIEGHKVQLPDGLSQQELDAAVDEIAASLNPQYPQHIQQALEQPYGAGDRVRSATQGATFGFGDEMEAAGLALEDLVTRGDWTYDEWTGALNERMDEFSNDNPVEDIALNVVGSIPTAIAAPAATWQKGASLGKNLGKLAAEGAAYGSITGWGTSEESLFDSPELVLQDAVSGGAIGAVLNPAIAGGLRGAGKLLGKDEARIAADQTYGIKTPLSEQYKGLSYVQKGLDNTLGGTVGAVRAGRRDKKQAEESIEWLKTMSNSEAGQVFRKEIKNWSENAKGYFTGAYRDLKDEVNMEGKVVPTETKKVLNDTVFADNKELGKIVIPNQYQSLKTALDGDTVSVEQLWATKQELGESFATGKFDTEDLAYGKMKQLYEAVLADLEKGIYNHAKGSKDDALNQFKEKNSEYENFLKMQRRLYKRINRSNPMDELSDSQVYDQLVKDYIRDPLALDDLMLMYNGRFGSTLIDEGVVTPLDGAGSQVVYGLGENGQGTTSSQVFLNNMRKARREIPQVAPSSGDGQIPVTLQRANYLSTPTSKVSSFDGSVDDAARAEMLSARAERSKVGSLGGLIGGQSLASVAAYMAAGGSIAPSVVLGLLGTYSLREILGSATVGNAVRKMVDVIRSKPIGRMTPEEIALLMTIQSSDTE